MGPADQVRTVVAQQLASPAVEGHGEVSAQVAVRHDGAAWVPKQHGKNWKTIVVAPELRGSYDPVPQLLLAAHPNLHCAQSFPGSLYAARAGTETRSRPGSHKPLNQPP